MRMLGILFLLVGLVVASCVTAHAGDVPAVECRPRAGLPNFLAKANGWGRT